MTKEDAITELSIIKNVYSGMRKEYHPCVEALQMAIEALQSDTPQTDLAEDAPRLEVTREEFEKIVEQIKNVPLRIERLAERRNE